jgi:hypothetical protein
MEFNEQVENVTDDAVLTPPSKWHIFYYLKWWFVVRPKLVKELNKAKAEVVDQALNSSVLEDRTKEDKPTTNEAA